jgi:hypothetical protein
VPFLRYIQIHPDSEAAGVVEMKTHGRERKRERGGVLMARQRDKVAERGGGNGNTSLQQLRYTQSTFRLGN